MEILQSMKKYNLNDCGSSWFKTLELWQKIINWHTESFQVEENLKHKQPTNL